MLNVLLLNQLPVVTVRFLYVYLSNFVFTLLYICCGFETYVTTAWPCLLLSYLLLFGSNRLCLWLTSPVAFQVLLFSQASTLSISWPCWVSLVLPSSSCTNVLKCLQERQSAEAAARDSVIAELHRRAARQAALSAAAQQHAVNWLQAPTDADDADYVKHHVDIVQSLLAQANLLQPVTSRKVKPAVDIAAAGEATIIAAAKAAAAEQAAGLATAATISDPVAAASAKAAAVDRAAAVVTAAVTSASAAEATANSAVAALQAAAADGAAPAAAVALAVDEAARALAAAKAKATATAEAALRAAVAQEEQRVVKKANTQLFVPLNQALGGLVDYPSDDDSHMSRALTDSQNLAQPSKGEAEVSSAERRASAAAAAQQRLSDRLNPAQAGQGSAHQPASWLPMYSMDLSSSHQQASSGAAGGAGDLEADATGGTPRAGHPAGGSELCKCSLSHADSAAVADRSMHAACTLIACNRFWFAHALISPSVCLFMH